MNPYLVPEEDVELNIREALSYIRRRWVSVVLAGIVFACLLGGLKAYRSLDRDEKTILEDETEAEEALNDYEEESEMYSSAMSNLRSSTARQNEYLQDSTLMKIDPYNTPTARSSLIITTRTKDKTIAGIVADEYRYHLLEGEYLEDLSRKTGVKTVPYIRELMDISVSRLSDTGVTNIIGGDDGGQAVSSTDVQTQESVDSEEDDNDITRYQVSIVIMGQDLDQASEILDGVMEEADRFGEKLGQQYQYKAYAKEKRSYLTMNNGLLNTQNAFYNNMTWTHDKKNNVRSTQDSMVKPSEPEKTESSETKPASISKKSLIKYAGAGFAAGILLMALYYLILYITNNKLISYKDMSSRFRLRDIGTYDDTGDSAQMILANIRNYIPDAKNILLVGTAGDGTIKEIKEKLCSLDPASPVQAGGNILDSPEARQNLSGADEIILVEKKNVSRYSSLERETEIISSAQKKIAGIIIC